MNKEFRGVKYVAMKMKEAEDFDLEIIVKTVTEFIGKRGRFYQD